MKKKSILFPIKIYDPGRAYSTKGDDGFAFATVDLQGGQYLLRNAFKMTLFRRVDTNNNDWTFFSYREAPKEAARLDEWLANVIEKRQYGRYLHWSPLKEPRSYEDHCFLFLRNEGTGRAFIDGRHFAIEWSHPEITDDVVILEPEQANELAKHVFNESVNVELDDPFLTEKNRREPIEFICGTQTELETVSQWICYIEPDLFKHESAISITFRSSAKDDEDTDDQTSGPIDPQRNLPGRTMTLLCIAYEYNNFAGGFREYRDYNDPYRMSGNMLYPEYISFNVNAPSAHERAEAWLQLADWLKGKVPEAERNALLGPKISDDV